MKKIYISPEIEIVECVPGTMIAVSLRVENVGPSGEDDFKGEGEGEAAGAARGDWGNIWDGM